jgi:hypothetical protein
MPSKDDESDEASTSDGYKQKLFRIMNRFYEIAFKNKAAVWTALFTGVLSVYTVKLFQVSNRTDDTTRNANRAFLNLQAVNLSNRLVDSLDPGDPQARWVGQEFAVVWNNTGNTPAKDVVIEKNAQIFRPNLPQAYDFPLLQDKEHAVIGARGDYGIIINVSKEFLSDLWHSKGKLFLWGTVIYKDVFPDDPDRISEFCIQITHPAANITSLQPSQTNSTMKGKTVAQEPSTLRPPLDIDAPGAQLVGFQWEQCPAHNCYDEDCPDYKDRVRDMR